MTLFCCFTDAVVFQYLLIFAVTTTLSYINTDIQSRLFIRYTSRLSLPDFFCFTVSYSEYLSWLSPRSYFAFLFTLFSIYFSYIYITVSSHPTFTLFYSPLFLFTFVTLLLILLPYVRLLSLPITVANLITGVTNFV